jgi:hypothetical protein
MFLTLEHGRNRPATLIATYRNAKPVKLVRQIVSITPALPSARTIYQAMRFPVVERDTERSVLLVKASTFRKLVLSRRAGSGR